MKRVNTAAIVIAIGLVVPARASASGVPEMSLGEVMRESKAVVHGVVVDQFSQWEESGGNKIIFTYSTLHVMNADFGRFSPTRDVVVRTTGGIVDGYQQVLIDEASFKMGEEALVFLTLEDGWVHPSVVGFHQGKYEVTRGASGRILGVRQDAGAAADPALSEKRPLIPMNRFAAELRLARRSLVSGESTDVHPLVRVR